MKKTCYVFAILLGFYSIQLASAETWDAGIAEHTKVKHRDTPDTMHGGVWDGGMSEHVKVKYPDTPQ